VDDAAAAVSPERVLLVTPRWTRNGGVGAHVQASAAALAARGVEVSVIAARADAGGPGTVAVAERPALFDRGAPPAARLGELPGQPTVAHLHQVDDPAIVELLRERVPVVSSAHAYTACAASVHYFDPGEECSRPHGPGCMANMLLRGCSHGRNPVHMPGMYRGAARGLQALAHADLVVSYSSAVDRHLAQNGLARRAVVPLFSTTEPRSGSGHDTRRRVVFAGRVIEPKGVHVLIRAMTGVPGELHVCGDGRELDDARRLAQRCGIEERVMFRGWLGAEELAEELAQASLVAMPSLWPEPFGLVGIESLASGRPVVASDTGGVRDWLEDGVSGVLVEPGEEAELARALGELLDDPERQRTMGEAGRRSVAQRFSPERHVAELLGAYAAARTHWRERRAAS
jgi:glycosyltransferase involved in cell wall biosynthesis